MNDLIPLNDVQAMARMMGKNKMFGKSEEDLLPLMLIAIAEHKHPAIAALEYDVIQGRPAINSRAALARFQASGGRIQWTKRTDTEVSATFEHPQGGKCEITWTMERATQAGLAGKPNWKSYPTQMLAARVIAEGVRAVFPVCLSGMYTGEEVADFDTPNLRDVTPPLEPEPEEPVRITLGATEDLRTACTRLSDTLGLSPERRKEIAKVHQGNLADIKATLEAMLPEAAP